MISQIASDLSLVYRRYILAAFYHRQRQEASLCGEGKYSYQDLHVC